MKCTNLACIETVTSAKLADKFQQACKAANFKGHQIDVMIQVRMLFYLFKTDKSIKGEILMF